MRSRSVFRRLYNSTRLFSTFQVSSRPFQIAIDGPSASGKSTTARLVAQEMGFDYIDTGAFYRCVTLAALRAGIDPSIEANQAKISSLAEKIHIDLDTVFTRPPATHTPSPQSSSVSGSPSSSSSSGTSALPASALSPPPLLSQPPAVSPTFSTPPTMPTTRVFLDHQDVSLEIRTMEITRHVSAIAAIGAVREAVLNKVRAMGCPSPTPTPKTTSTSTSVPPLSPTNSNPLKPSLLRKPGLVMDGRDIGTKVLPTANLKIFLVADSRIRAERRLGEMQRNRISSNNNNDDSSKTNLSGEQTNDESMVDQLERIRLDLERRDELDRTRTVSPLRKAEDALELNTSTMTIDGQVQWIVNEAKRILDNDKTKTGA